MITGKAGLPRPAVNARSGPTTGSSASPHQGISTFFSYWKSGVGRLPLFCERTNLLRLKGYEHIGTLFPFVLRVCGSVWVSLDLMPVYLSHVTITLWLGAPAVLPVTFPLESWLH